MKKIDFKILILTTIICVLPIAIGIAYYNVLPESIAIHFDINNTPNNFWSKDAFVFGMPLLMLAFQFFVCIVSDLTDTRKEANKKMRLVAKFTIPIITFILYLVTISYALGNKLDIRVIAMWLVGIMFIVMGNYLPKTKGNNYIRLGGKVLENEEVSQKVTKLMGYMYMINGILAIVSTFLKPIYSVLVIVLVIIEILFVYIYAWKLTKN